MLGVAAVRPESETRTDGRSSAAPSPAVAWEVLRVVDGDTLEVRSPVDKVTERVRIVGIDAPERSECWADEATAALTLQAGRMVTLERDVSDRDRYGRLLRSIRNVSGQDVAGVLLDGGHVIARSYPPDTSRDAEYRDRQEAARSAGLGLWAADACGAVGSILMADAIGITIQADPPGDDTLVPNDEWVAFTNLGASDLDLTEWQVRDESASHRYRFGRTVLAPGEHVTLRTGCGTDTAADRHWCVTGSAVWNNRGDTVFLLDPVGTVVTWLAYGSSLAGSPTPGTE